MDEVLLPAVVVLFFAALLVMAYQRRPLWLFSCATFLALGAATLSTRISPEAIKVLRIVFGAFVVLLHFHHLRRQLISRPVLALFRELMPSVSRTEREAHSAVIVKLVSRSITAAVTAMVPNSLGPAKLLLNYGTEAQKEYYLHRLARGGRSLFCPDQSAGRK